MREFPQSSLELHPLNWVIPLALLVGAVLTACLLRTNRKVQSTDAFFWLLAGVILTPLFLIRGEDESRLDESRVNAMLILWLIILLACILSSWRVVRQQEGKQEYTFLFSSLLCLVLAAVFVTPAIQQSREHGPRTTCRSNLHLIGLGLYNYHETYEVWPSQYAGDPPHSWRVALLPYADGQHLYEQYDFTSAWNADANRPVMTSYLRYYVCPSMDWPERGQPVETSYALLVGDHAAWTSRGFTDPDDIPDGSSHTAIVAEACGLGIIWTAPRDIDLATTPIGINLRGEAPGHSPGILSTYHAKGANVLMADGSVRRLSIDTDPAILNAILTADGGEEDSPF